MRFKKVITVVLPVAVAGLAASAAIGTAASQAQTRRAVRLSVLTAGYTPEVKIEVRGAYRYITSNGIPNHAVGQFPNSGNPNRISPQDYHFRVPLDPTPSASGTFPGQVFGVAVNGVVFDPGTAELWNGDFRWHYEALTGLLGARGALGADANFAHVQPNGAYHYHGLPMGLLTKLDYTHKMALVGYAADGYPIYGPYVYSVANDPKSPLKLEHSGYRIKDGERPSDGPGGAYDGSFASDYGFVKGASDLDEYDGRVGVTPEYPKGTFYYVLTDNWPFVPRQFQAAPDQSFEKGPGGPGGPGGRQGGPGGGPGGFGGPGGGMGGPGGGGPGRPGGGPPRGMVPGSVLGQYLGLTAAQKQKLADLMAAMDALGREGFAVPQFSQLKLTGEQVHKLAAGDTVGTVLTAEQKKVLDANRRPGGGGPGGGMGGPGGGFGGPQGGPDGGPGGGPGGQGGPGGFGGPGDGQGGPDGGPPPPGGMGGPGDGPGGPGGPGMPPPPRALDGGPTDGLRAAAAPSALGVTRVPVVFSGGHETAPRDRGRPVVLVAGALGVPPEVFREAFSHVHPAGAGMQPEPDQVRQNKAALMSALGPYGVTNDRLDAVSNYYRYVKSQGQMWPTTPAKAVALVKGGVVVGYEITSGGSGYSSAPTVSVPGVQVGPAVVKLGYGKTPESNGTVSALTVTPSSRE